ncbi:hypothetical protein Tco_0101891 [Tanacetum coccineum]
MKIFPDKEGVAIDAIPLDTKPPTIVDWKILKEGKIIYFQIIRADGSSKRHTTFIQMLKSFDREDLETLWKLVKAKHGSTRSEKGYGRIIGIKSLLEVTAAQLMLLVYKLLLLVFRVNDAGIKVTTVERLQLLKEFMLTEKRSKTYQRKNKDFLKIKIT